MYPVIAEPFIAPAAYGIEMAVAPVAATVPMVGASGANGARVVTLNED